MWSFKKPTDLQIENFLASQRQLPFSYPEVGQTRDGSPTGYDIDHNRIALGTGQKVFDAARAAFQGWQMFPAPLAEIHPPNTPIEAGNAVVMLARAAGCWWLNAARVVYVFDEQEPVRRFGFGYGTLPDHVECGEERFSIVWDHDDTIWYDIRAFSRPRYWLVRLGYPFARRLQRRFVLQSQAKMRALVAGLAAQP